MNGEKKVVYVMIVVSLLVVGGWFVLWNYSSKRAAARVGKSDLMVEKSVDRDMEIVDSNGVPRKFSDLKDKVTLVSHVFTRCPGQCAGIGLVLDELRNEYSSQGPLHLLSVSLDPGYDTPEILGEFSRQHKLVGDNWWFVTGAADPLNEYMLEVFAMAAQPKPAEERVHEGDLFTHQAVVVLVDKDLKLRGWYFPFEDASLKKLRMELKSALTEAS